MKRSSTLVELLSAGADAAPVFGAPATANLSYGQLRQLIINTVTQLNGWGIGRNDRVAIVLKNGPEMAASFLAVACGTTSAPLNPAYRADEFEFYLSDLKAKALIVEKGSDTPAIEVAKKLGVTLLELVPTPAQGAGSFTLENQSMMLR
jgi:acyl-CoA synthetase (AMP-forming)/AMP-acid ligase II